MVLSTQDWAQHLPDRIQAFFYIGEGGYAASRARANYKDFMEAFPHSSAPLLALDLGNLGSPFRFDDDF